MRNRSIRGGIVILELQRWYYLMILMGLVFSAVVIWVCIDLDPFGFNAVPGVRAVGVAAGMGGLVGSLWLAGVVAWSRRAIVVGFDDRIELRALFWHQARPLRQSISERLSEVNVRLEDRAVLTLPGSNREHEHGSIVVATPKESIRMSSIGFTALNTDIEDRLEAWKRTVVEGPSIEPPEKPDEGQGA